MSHTLGSFTGVSATLLGIVAPLAEEGASPAWYHGPPYYIGLGFVALLLAAAHCGAPSLRQHLRRHAPIVGSFGGGMAVGYVFLHMIPELDAGHESLGALIYGMPLLGFSTYYLVHHVFCARTDRARRGVRASFAARLINLTVYNALILYGGPGLGMEDGLYAIPMVLAIVLHLLHLDFSFGEDFPGLFDSIGRFVLAAACVGVYGWVVLQRMPDETVGDILVAFLAGSVLFSVFRDEIPDDSTSHIEWFIGGIAVFAVAALPTLR